MGDIIQWLEAHDALAGWAQFFGTLLALFVTYLTVFAPNWRRSRQLRAEALRLLMHGYEVIESFHRTSGHFRPFPLSLRQMSLSMTAAIEDLGRFPVYELDKNFGPMSLAMRLMGMRITVETARLYTDRLADEQGDRTATEEETEQLRHLIDQPLQMAHSLLLNKSVDRPQWPTNEGGQPTS